MPPHASGTSEMSTHIIRCGTPDCDWGFPVGRQNVVERCYEEFREHCVERHDLRETDTNAQMWIDFKEGTLTLWKG
jgi:hypothetical protein